MCFNLPILLLLIGAKIKIWNCDCEQIYIEEKSDIVTAKKFVEEESIVFIIVATLEI